MAADVDAWAWQAGLGGFRGAFRPTRRLRWEERKTGDKVGLVIAGVVVFGILGLIIIGLTFAVPVLGLVLLAFVVGLFGWSATKGKSRARSNEGRELRIYELGVAVVGTGGTTAKPYRWADITVLQNITRHHRNGVYTHTTYAYTLSGPGVEATRVNGGVVGTFEQPDTWGTEIQQQVTTAQLPCAVAAVQAGQTLEFGGFAVNAERLTAGGKSVAWVDVQQIKTDKGYLSVKQQGRWLNMTVRAVSQIPNFFVFRALADHLVETARSPR
jgi:hypothetical protein